MDTTYSKMKALIDKWWERKIGWNCICIKPEITIDFGPTKDTCPEITIRHSNRILKRILNPYILYEESNIIAILDDMWEEMMKNTIHPTDYDTWPMAAYIKHDSTAIVKAYDDWCRSNLIKKVIFSDPCTIVIWSDGTKTIVRCTDEKFDKEKGLAMCIAKKSLGNKGKYYDVFKKWIEEEEK